MSEQDTDPGNHNNPEPQHPTLPLRALHPEAAEGAGSTGSALPVTLWSQVGGTQTFTVIARAFYRGVRQDPVLAPMYPQEDWEGAEWRLRSFLEQYWGGPTTYSETRGHPRLRMRHAPFHINPDARDRWLKHMFAALDEAQLPPIHDAAFRDYVERAAHAMVNTHE